MKRRLLVLMTLVTVSMSLMACGENKNASGNSALGDNASSNQVTTVVSNNGANDNKEQTLGDKVVVKFKESAKESQGAEAIVNSIIDSGVVDLDLVSMPVNEGLLTGFGNTEIKGFKEGVMFSPMIGAIPFVGYVFVLDDNTDFNTFIMTLNENADLRWNVCNEAEQKIIESEGNVVLFLMCPKTIEE